MARSSNLSVLTCSAAVLLAGLVYLNTLHNPFVYDDARSILNNRSLTTRASVTAVVRENVSRPLVSLSYFIDHAIWGPAPFGYHVTNVLLHMLNVALLFLFTRGVVIVNEPYRVSRTVSNLPAGYQDLDGVATSSVTRAVTAPATFQARAIVSFSPGGMRVSARSCHSPSK